MLNSKGGLEFGFITSETGLQPAPILLSEGIITNPKTGDGYGLVHIEFRHGDQIRKEGYNSVLDFIEEVGNNYEVIREGKDRFGNPEYSRSTTVSDTDLVNYKEMFGEILDVIEKHHN